MRVAKLIFLVGVVSFLLLLLLTPKLGQAQSYQMRIATHQPAGDSVGMAVEKLADLINAESKGRIKAKSWTGGSLGSERVLCEMTRGDSLEVCTSLQTGMARYVPELAVFALPYLYTDTGQMLKALKALRPVLDDLLAPHNIKPLGYIDLGIRHMINRKRPIYTVADMKGLKIRVPNPLYAGMINVLGASASTISWTEVYTSLQTGVIDGLEASASLFYSNRMYEQAKYLSKTYHSSAGHCFMTNRKWYDNLPKDLQEVVFNATEEASKYQNTVERDFENKVWEKLSREGVKINEVKDLKEFSDKCVAFREKYVKENGPNFEALYKKVLAMR